MSCMVRCTVCRQIPLDIRHCITCDAVICKKCKHELREEENFEKLQDLQDDLNHSDLRRGCPNCLQNPDFILTKGRNLTVKRKLDEAFEMHHCCDGTKALESEYTADLGTLTEIKYRDLKHHLSTCKKNRTCKDCNIEFHSEMEFQNHLRARCPHVKIKCSDCYKSLTRKDFRAHECYK